MTIFQDPPETGCWYYRYPRDESGQQKTKSLRTKDRKLAQERVTNGFLTGTAIETTAVSSTGPGDPLIQMVLDFYVDHRIEGPHVANTSTPKQRCKWLGLGLGKLRVSQINAVTLKQYLAARTDPKSKLHSSRMGAVAPQTVNGELIALRAAINFWHHQHGNQNFNIRIKYFPATPKRRRGMTEQEFKQLLASVSAPVRGNRTSRHYRYLILAWFSGQRRATIERLRWDQINFDGEGGLGVIDFRTPGKMVTGKRQHEHFIMVPELRAYLLQWRAERLKGCPWVLDLPGSIIDWFRAACHRLGIHGVVPHSIRHATISAMGNAGIPIAVIADAIRVTTKTIESVYLHIDGTQNDRARQAVVPSFLQPPGSA